MLKHLIKGKADVYTICGIALDNLFGSWTIPINSDLATKDIDQATCPECLKLLPQ